MHRYLILAFVAFLSLSIAQAQTFSGKGALGLQTVGSQTATNLISYHTVGKYYEGEQTFKFYLKTKTLTLGAANAHEEMLRQILLTDGYPVMEFYIFADENALSQKGEQRLEAEIHMMGRVFPVNADVTIENLENQIRLNAIMSLDLRGNDFQIPEAFEAEFGPVIRFNLDQFALVRR